MAKLHNFSTPVSCLDETCCESFTRLFLVERDTKCEGRSCRVAVSSLVTPLSLSGPRQRRRGAPPTLTSPLLANNKPL